MTVHQGGSEGEREGGREGGREGERERGREGGREGGRLPCDNHLLGETPASHMITTHLSLVRTKGFLL